MRWQEITKLTVMTCFLGPNVYGQFQSASGGSHLSTKIRSTTKDLKKAEPDSPPEMDMVQPVACHHVKYDCGGTYVDIDFRTTAPAAAMVLLSDDMMLAEPFGESWTTSSPAQRWQFTNPGTHHRVIFKDLKPNTLYFIVIMLKPEPGYGLAGWEPWDTFVGTKKRRVSVGIPYIKVIDDSDDLSAGDLAFGFQLGPENGNFDVAGNTWDHTNRPIESGFLDLASGDEFWPWISLVGSNVGNTAKLAISCLDNDDEFRGGRKRVPDKYLGTGCNSVAEWNSGFWILDVDGGTEMSPGETLADRESFSFNHIRTVYESDHSCLEYQIWAVVNVSYE